MRPEPIASLDGLPVYRQYEVDDALIDLFERTTWGTGDTQYEHYYARHHLQLIPHPNIFTLRDGDEILGAVVLCRRTLRDGRTAYYIRYFAASPKIKGKGLVGRISPTVMDFILSEATEPTIFYASTEYYNRRVKRITEEVGFQQLARTFTFGFSRLTPRVKGEVAVITGAEFQAFLPQLEAFYADYAFWVTDNLDVDDQYFVLREKGEVIAGVQAHQGLWRVSNMPGFVGRYLLPLVPYTPLGRIFDPREFRFLGLEGIYVKAGHEHRLQDLFETVLHRMGLHAALFWMVEHDPLRDRILRHNRMGILHFFVRSVLARFWATFHHIDPAEEAGIRQQPYYISSLDYI